MKISQISSHAISSADSLVDRVFGEGAHRKLNKSDTIRTIWAEQYSAVMAKAYEKNNR